MSLLEIDKKHFYKNFTIEDFKVADVLNETKVRNFYYLKYDLIDSPNIIATTPNSLVFYWNNKKIDKIAVEGRLDKNIIGTIDLKECKDDAEIKKQIIQVATELVYTFSMSKNVLVNHVLISRDMTTDSKLILYPVGNNIDENIYYNSLDYQKYKDGYLRIKKNMDQW